MLKVLVKLFQKFAEYEAEPHFNARASALATAHQNHEALLRDFGLNNHFPIVGKWLLSHYFAHIKGKNPRADFHIFIKFRPWFRLGARSFAGALTAHPTPSRKREGRNREILFFSFLNIIIQELRRPLRLIILFVHIGFVGWII